MVENADVEAETEFEELKLFDRSGFNLFIFITFAFILHSLLKKFSLFVMNLNSVTLQKCLQSKVFHKIYIQNEIWF